MIKSIRPFIGAKDYRLSQQFYRAIGFTGEMLSEQLMVFKQEGFAFYLQDAYVEDWVQNSMVFLEHAQVGEYLNELKKLKLPELFEGVRISEMKQMPWGEVFYLHDPSGILWHIGKFHHG